MASLSISVFFVLSHLLLLHLAEGENRIPPYCSSFHCGNLGIIGFPFFDITNPFCGGLLPVNCDKTPPTIQPDWWWSGREYEVINFSYTNTTQSTTHIKDLSLSDHLNTQKCEFLTNLTFLHFPFISYEITSPNQTLFKCNRTLPITSPTNFKKLNCNDDYNIYYSHSNHTPPSSLSKCSIIQLPKREKQPVRKDLERENDQLLSLITAEFDLEVHVSDACTRCYDRGGRCEHDMKGIFYCAYDKKGNESIHNRISCTYELVLKVLCIILLS